MEYQQQSKSAMKSSKAVSQQQSSSAMMSSSSSQQQSSSMSLQKSVSNMSSSSVFEREQSVSSGAMSSGGMMVSGGMVSGGMIAGGIQRVNDDCPMHGDHGDLKVVRVCVFFLLQTRKQKNPVRILFLTNCEPVK